MVKIHSDRIGQQVFSEPRGPARKQQQVTNFMVTQLDDFFPLYRELCIDHPWKVRDIWGYASTKHFFNLHSRGIKA